MGANSQMEAVRWVALLLSMMIAVLVWPVFAIILITALPALVTLVVFGMVMNLLPLARR